MMKLLSFIGFVILTYSATLIRIISTNTVESSNKGASEFDSNVTQNEYYFVSLSNHTEQLRLPSASVSQLSLPESSPLSPLSSVPLLSAESSSSILLSAPNNDFTNKTTNVSKAFHVDDLNFESSFQHSRAEPVPWVKHNAQNGYESRQSSNDDEYDDDKPATPTVPHRQDYNRHDYQYDNNNHHHPSSHFSSSSKGPVLRHEYNYQTSRGSSESPFKYNAPSGRSGSNAAEVTDRYNPPRSGNVEMRSRDGEGGNSGGPVVRHEWTNMPSIPNTQDGSSDEPIPPPGLQSSYNGGHHHHHHSHHHSNHIKHPPPIPPSSQYPPPPPPSSHPQSHQQSDSEEPWISGQAGNEGQASQANQYGDQPMQYEEEASEIDEIDDDDEPELKLPPPPASSYQNFGGGLSLTKYQGSSALDIFEKYRKAKDSVKDGLIVLPRIKEIVNLGEKASKREYSVSTKYKKGKKYEKKYKKMKMKKKKKKKCKKKKCKKVKKCKKKKKCKKPKKKKCCKYEKPEWGGWGEYEIVYKKPKKIKFDPWNSWGGFDSYGSTYEGGKESEYLTAKDLGVFGAEYLSEAPALGHHHPEVWVPEKKEKDSYEEEEEDQEDGEDEEDHKEDREDKEPYARIEPMSAVKQREVASALNDRHKQSTQQTQPLEPVTKYEADRPYEVHEADLFPPKFDGDSVNFGAFDPLVSSRFSDTRFGGFPAPFSSQDQSHSSTDKSENNQRQDHRSINKNNSQQSQSNEKWKKRPPQHSEEHADDSHHQQSGHRKHRVHDRTNNGPPNRGEAPVDWKRTVDGDSSDETWQTDITHRNDWKTGAKQSSSGSSSKHDDDSWNEREKE